MVVSPITSAVHYVGECGCGKTYLLSYLCAWLGVTLLTLDVHGGTSEDEIIDVFDRAANILEHNQPEEGSTPAERKGHSASFSFGSNVFVFLDEVNTCAHMGLM